MNHALRVSIVAVVATLAWPRAAAAEPPPSADIKKRVDTHLERGIEFYAEKQYELAIVEFRAGYGLDPRPELLFALAQAERLSGDCPTAVVYYQRFLDTNPDSNQAEAARVNMRRCKRALESGVEGRPAASADQKLDGAEQASEPAPAPVPGAASGAQPASMTLRDRRSGGPDWYRDPVGGSLAAGSAVGLGLGLGFWLAKSGAESDAREALDYATHEDALARARRNRTISLVATGAGVALAGAAAYRYLTLGSNDDRTAVTVVPTAGGGAVSLSGRF